MRRLAFGLGTLLQLLAAGLLAARLLAWLTDSRVAAVSLGMLWAGIDANSLVGFQALIEKSLSPALWPAILWVLLLPAWLVFALIGLAMLWLGRPRHSFR